jgi:radial spoke head protein 4/6
MIKYIFTGNLNAEINSTPPFPGKERHLLRAQLARITHGAAIIPKGLIEVDEETGKEKFAEEFTMPTAPEEVKSLEIWGHQHPILLQAGRVTHIAPPTMNEEEKEEYLGKLAETDAPVDRFRALNEDQPMPGLEFSWLSKVAGDIQPYN